ncbi:MAG: 1-aminocyclopropane-1-carboxylate deaminase/D-cysteine desulfhydrase, partial [Halanaerobiales bacterium]
FKELEDLECNCVVTYGSSSSNHCRVVANIAASKELRCIIISPTETSKSTYNSKMMELFGAEVISCQVSEVKNTIDKRLNDLTLEGYKPYFIQGGGHGNLGTKAYINAYEEIRNYEMDNDIFFDYLFHTSGTGTTQAGLVCGQLMHNDKRQIIGISNARKNPYGGKVVFDSVNSYLESIDKERVNSQLINFIDDYVLDGYGTYDNDVLETIKEVLIQEGIPLDPIYTGKAFWGMKKYIRKNQITGKRILFIHTGGTPLFFDDWGVIK